MAFHNNMIPNGALYCEQTHELKSLLADKYKYYCRNCYDNQIIGTPGFGCDQCHYFLCKKCGAKRNLVAQSNNHSNNSNNSNNNRSNNNRSNNRSVNNNNNLNGGNNNNNNYHNNLVPNAAYNCEQTHKLKYLLSDKLKYFCRHCFKPQQVGSKGFGCNQCHYFLCQRCGERHNNLKVPQSNNSHSHNNHSHNHNHNHRSNNNGNGNNGNNSNHGVPQSNDAFFCSKGHDLQRLDSSKRAEYLCHECYLTKSTGHTPGHWCAECKYFICTGCSSGVGNNLPGINNNNQPTDKYAPAPYSTNNQNSNSGIVGYDWNAQ